MKPLGRKPLSYSNRRSQRVMSRITQEEYLALELSVAELNDEQSVGTAEITTSKYVQVCIQNNKRVIKNLKKIRGKK